MANLRKYKFTGGSSTTGPKATASSTSPDANERDSSQLNNQVDMADIKAEILQSLKKDIVVLLKSEIKTVLVEELGAVRHDLQEVKEEVANNTATIRSDLDTMKTTMSEMERGLSSCSDEVTSLQTKVDKLETEVSSLREKYQDIEGRMRRSNIRILNVPETPGSSTPSAVSNLLKKALKMDKTILVDRSHRGPQTRRPDKPRVIVAKLHYYQDCVEILRRARESGSLQINGSPIYIFPDYPPSVVQARSAFMEVKRLLRGQTNVRYGLIYPARLRVTHNGTEKQFLNPEEALKYVKTEILPET